jgi:hypothetical protein
MENMFEMKHMTRRRLEGRMTGGGDGNGRPITNGDYVWTRERCREKYVTLIVGHVGGGAGVHDPPCWYMLLRAAIKPALSHAGEEEDDNAD